jgi:4-amino-4-deoxy-L-arabinose transferase-like glycosyltransferase
MNARQRWAIAGILLLGLVLRCIALTSRGIAYDDAFSIFLARQSFPNIISGTAADTMPPLYYFLLHVWIDLGGDGLGWLRGLSVGLNLASLVVFWRLVARLGGETAGLWAALLGAISPLQIYHAQDLRMYALLVLAQLAYCLFFVRIWQKPGRSRWGNWAGLVLSGAAAMYTHNLAVFVLVLPDLILLLRRAWRPLVHLLLAQAAIGLLALPWLVLLPGQMAKIQQAFWTPRPGIVEVIQSLILFTTNLPLPEGLLAAGLGLSLLGLIVLVIELVRLGRQKLLPGFLLGLTLLPPALIFAASYLMRPVFVTRGFLAAALGYLGLAGVVIAQRLPRLPAGLILVCFVAGAGLGLPAHYSFNEFPRSPFQAATGYLRGKVSTGDVIIYDDKLSFFPAHYYAPDLPQVFLADQPGSPNDTLAPASQAAMGLYPQANIEQAAEAAPRVFFVVFETTLQEYQQAGLADPPQIVALKKSYRAGETTRFNDLLVLEFVR